MKNIIPGHARAFTWLLALVLSATVFLKTNNLRSVLGSFLIVLGAFLGDQATHLAQEEHSGEPPTWIERKMQNHRFLFVFFGLITSTIGIYILAE